MAYQQALRYVEENRELFLDELKELLRIPSISTAPEHASDVRRAAEWLVAYLDRIGFGNAEIMETGGHPVAYAEWIGAQDRPTILVYGHYDVQPVDPVDAWDSPPFEPTERDGFLYARGSSDDKGQLFAQLRALEAILATTGSLPVNVKVLLEGEEEISSPNLAPFLEEHKARFQTNSVAVSDGSIVSPEQPSITYALRGIAALQFDVRSAAHDMHSGRYGGAIHNPAQAVAEILAALHNPDGSVAVPGFYDRVRDLTDADRALIAGEGYTLEDWERETGGLKPWGEADYTFSERIKARPTLEVNGIYGGYSGEGKKTVIPATAGAKITCRLVPDQDPDEILDIVAKQIESLTPDTVEVTVTKQGGGGPVVVSRDLPEIEAAKQAYAASFGIEPIFTREGGTIPAVSMFEDQLGMPSILLGLGLPDDGLHRPNERFSIDLFYKGIETLIHYYAALGSA